MNVPPNTHFSAPPFRERRRRRLKQSIYVMPSLVTASAMFCGFYSIVLSIRMLFLAENNMGEAALFIIIAAGLDGLDGRLARTIQAESDFGMHFDSIADMVSFGVAPAVFAYCTSLISIDRWGWLGAFTFLACAAIRLARFNVLSTSNVASRKYFKGLSSPVAAGGLVTTLYVMSEVTTGRTFYYFALGVTIFLATLMVSNIRFRSFKDLNFGAQKLQVFLASIFILVMSFSFKQYALFGFFICYVIAGLIEELILFRRRRKSDPSVPFLPFGDRE